MGIFYEDASLTEYRDSLMINEAYVGKTPTLLEIENKIGEARAKIKYSGANNTLKEVLEINRLFEKQFGMEIFALKIYPSDIANAYTMVLARNFDIAEEEILHNMIEANAQTGYRFKPDNGFCIIMNIASSLITDPQYTNGEILAILLHELGHNFADCIYKDIEIANRDMMLATKRFLLFYIIIFALCGRFDLVKLYLSLYNRKKRRKEKRGQKVGKGKIAAFIGSLRARGADLGALIDGVLARLSGGRNIAMYKRMADSAGTKKEARKSLDRQNEIIADKFAGIYGYGPEQATALLKLTNTTSKAAKIVNKLGKFGRNMNDAFDKEMLDINDYDCHPQVIQRIMEEVKLIENELKREDIDPKVKELLQSQLDELKAILESATTVSDEMTDKEKAQAEYNKYILNQNPDSVDKEIEDKIEKALNDALYGN